ncbi:MAG: transporter substrate-binding domain-containing protein [Clostridia bacterium]|nr:transporter substrate-binding domain-containing protein [Clostridia bacterium]MBQ1965381.1 transporter substrate-binding domain-containing protein [Clostridia bacterium]
MKKFIALMLAVLMGFCLLTACTPAEENNTNTDSNTASAGDVNNDANNGAKEELVMATNAFFPPYEYYDENNKVVGIDAEIAAAIADKLGMTLKIEDMKFDSIITSVATGGADFGMAGMTVTDKRKEQVNFTNTYATGKQVVIVKDGGAVATLDDLAGKKIGVQLGTTGDIYATGDYGTNEDETENGNVIRYNNGNEAILALIGGDVDAVIIDNEPAKSLVNANPGKGLSILETEYVYEEYAIAVNKNNTELLNKLNTAIDALIADGTVQRIIEKYIPANG